MVKVSVIVPVCNCEAYIDKCLDSIQKQNFDSMEIIVVDDGSDDDSYEIMERHRANHPGMIKVIKQSNQGASVARNHAMNLAKGEYIAFVDADDYIDSEYLRLLYDEAKAHDSDMVFCGYRMVDTAGTVIRTVRFTHFLGGGEGYAPGV